MRLSEEEYQGLLNKKQQPKSKPMYALGRLKTGLMNKTETEYAAYLETERHLGSVAWYKFEGVKLRLADNTSYSPDFIVMLADGLIEMHEVKGFMMEDAAVKVKVAADIYPFKFKIIKKKALKHGGGWDVKDVGNKA